MSNDRLILTTPDPITKEQYEFIRNKVYAHSKINLGPDKKDFVMARLSKRLKDCKFSSYAEYCDFIESVNGQSELCHFIDAISTNHTFFFREISHFDFFSQHVIPEFENVFRSGQTFKVWSAACSSGEEAFTISIVLHEAFKNHTIPPWNIVCSDISKQILDKAKAGIFEEDRAKQIRHNLIEAYFQKEPGKASNLYKAKPILRRGMLFYQHNLLTHPYPFKDKFHVIFCRNVMIYFDKPTQAQLILKISHHLAPGGYLFIGHSESLTHLKHSLEFIQPAVYRKPTHS